MLIFANKDIKRRIDGEKNYKTENNFFKWQ